MLARRRSRHGGTASQLTTHDNYTNPMRNWEVYLQPHSTVYASLFVMEYAALSLLSFHTHILKQAQKEKKKEEKPERYPRVYFRPRKETETHARMHEIRKAQRSKGKQKNTISTFPSCSSSERSKRIYCRSMLFWGRRRAIPFRSLRFVPSVWIRVGLSFSVNSFTFSPLPISCVTH